MMKKERMLGIRDEKRFDILVLYLYMYVYVYI